jgi:hypothetical protein
LFENGVAGIRHVYDIDDFVFCVMVFWGAKGNRQCYHSSGLGSFAAEAIERLRRFLELLLVITHFFEGQQEEYFCLAAIIDENS